MDQILDLWRGLDPTLLLVYLRLQAFVLILPGFGERVLPARVKVAVAAALTPLLHEGAMVPMQIGAPTDLIVPALSEMAVGFATGSFVRLLALALDIAATAISSAASLSQLLGGANEMSPHPIGNLMHLAGLAILFALGFPVVAAQLVADSYLLWPLGDWPPAGEVMPLIAGMMTRSFTLAMLLAAPFVLGGFLFQALSGVINKVMPALPVIFIGAPAAILLALVALAVMAPLLVGLWADAVLSLTLPRP